MASRVSSMPSLETESGFSMNSAAPCCAPRRAMARCVCAGVQITSASKARDWSAASREANAGTAWSAAIRLEQRGVGVAGRHFAAAGLLEAAQVAFADAAAADDEDGAGHGSRLIARPGPARNPSRTGDEQHDDARGCRLKTCNTLGKG